MKEPPVDLPVIKTLVALLKDAAREAYDVAWRDLIALRMLESGLSEAHAYRVADAMMAARKEENPNG